MLRLFSSSAALLLLLSVATSASAQVEAQVEDLNSQAMEAYQALDMDTARAKLEQAIGIAQQNGLMGPVVAQAFVNLGVVQITGFNDPNQGGAAFVAALCTQPDVQLDPLLSTPDVAQAFAQAQNDAHSGACGPAPGPGQGPGPGPGPGGPPLMPQQPPPGYGQPPPGYGGGGGDIDAECPPGVACHAGEGGGPERTDFARAFVSLQLGVGLAYVSSGMEADSPAPLGDIFVMKVANDFDAMGNQIMVNRFYFNETSAWVPDKDSFDDYEEYKKDGQGNVLLDPMTMLPTVIVPRGRTPVPGNCAADGKPTGPMGVMGPDGKPFAALPPSKYCVRVEQPGMVANLALRGNLGYFLSNGFALSMPLRFQFNAGTSSFSHLTIGLRGEVLFSDATTATGLLGGFFFGATYGQIQVKPPPKDPTRPAPYAKSGPIGAHIGSNIRYRIIRNFGVIVSPEVDVQFPGFLLDLDLMAGVEGAF